MLAAPPEVAAQCDPICFEADNTDLLLTGVLGWNTLPVAHSHGDGTFTVTNAYVGEFGTWAANPAAKKLTGDFDGNGWQDVALIGVPGWNTVPIAFSNGDGTFFVRNQPIDQFAYWASLPGVVPLVGDYNGDHLSDIALTGNSGWSTLPVALSMGPEQGFGRFLVYNEPITNFASWAAMAGATKLTGDFNGDGRTDIALTGVQGWNTLPVAFSNGFGGFAVTNMGISGAGNPFGPSGPQTFADWAARPGVVKLPGDFNGDGRTDIALVGGSSIGSCFWQVVYPSSGFYEGCALPVAFSNGNGTFTVTSHIDDLSACWPSCNGYHKVSDFAYHATGYPGVTPFTGDFDGDGRTDIALADQGQNGLDPMDVVLSRGDGFFYVTQSDTWFTLQQVYIFQAPGARCIPGDFDGNGTTDVAITGPGGWSTIPVFFSGAGPDWIVTNRTVPYFPGWASTPGAVKLGGGFN
jgi:hypothetical protein